MFYGMNDIQLIDFQFELQQSKEKTKNTPIILSLGFRYIKLYEDRYEYWIKKKIIKRYRENNNDLIRGGCGNVIYCFWNKKDESYQDFQVDREIWMNYDKIEIVENIVKENKIFPMSYTVDEYKFLEKLCNNT